MSTEELELVWNSIKAEARLLANYEPMLASFFHATLLKHENLGNALSYILAHKLSDTIMPAIAIREVVEEAYRSDPGMIFSAARDIHAVRFHDPVVDKYSTPLLYLKGVHALQAYRISHWLWYQNRQELAIYFQNQISVSFGVDIHPAARIGCGIMLDHATGIVIGETAVVEDDVSILQSVTLGATGKISGDRHPKIREGVMIGAGATIIGNIEVGRRAKIGAGSVVLRSVPAYSTAAGVPARVVDRPRNARSSEELDQSFITPGFECGAGI
ncbi:serine O-acetyltransferase [secondary endosymbiont of Ctenarytaina eucalypti]|uniref:Serine acetyltransferase n=1 Tax=secondary endosymbiont of Ctenarytaina eucalypti TaxID=1199245 RepID=J3TF25_9ENTR|nr:serine O-acetyltransferase [secondary endosymbiont of Ctenarytaina eucalypti]AFP84622.1 serine O-acetyltransferase [secondary endosymbiont of Ctenarytaina eucalypti]